MFKWFRKAARPTDPVPGFAMRPDYDDAVKWFRKAAEKGTSWGQFNLGLCYGRGNGVSQDYAEAMKWFLKAAEQGEAMSQYSLGRMYEEGLGVLQDNIEAYKWFHLAAGHGVANAEKARNLLQQNLSVDQIAQGRGRAAAFKPTLTILNLKSK